MVFDEYNLPLLISMALRELIWFKAENLNGEYLHSGYDMYFYLGVLEIIEKEFPDVFGSIYVEKAVSPYLEDE